MEHITQQILLLRLPVIYPVILMSMKGMGGLAEMTQCEAYHAENPAFESTCEVFGESYVNEGMGGLEETKTTKYNSQPLNSAHNVPEHSKQKTDGAIKYEEHSYL